MHNLCNGYDRKEFLTSFGARLVNMILFADHIVFNDVTGKRYTVLFADPLLFEHLETVLTDGFGLYSKLDEYTRHLRSEV